MSIARTARRRRRQFQIGFRHLAPLGRPRYKQSRPTLSVHDAIAAERAKAARMAAASKGKKKVRA